MYIDLVPSVLVLQLQVHSHWQQQQQEKADIVVDRWEQANLFIILYKTVFHLL